MYRAPAASVALLLAVSASPAVAGDWTGVYVGAGASFTRHNVWFPNGADTVTMTDTTPPGVGTWSNGSGTLDQTGNSVGGHILGGVRYQWNRFVLGAEADYEFNSRFGSPLPPGRPTCQNGFVITTGHAGCVGLGVYFTDVKTLGHVRGTVGFELTPSMLGFIAGGLAIGRSPDSISARASGIVVSNPSSPLVGQATVTRSGIGETIYGYTIGGGLEVKAGYGFSLRTEFLHDRYQGHRIAVGGAGFGGTIGEVTTNSFATPGNRLNYSSQTVRISAIYQFGGDEQPPPEYLTASDWTGFYVGGGLTMQNHALEFLNSPMRLSMTNNQTGVTEVYEPSQAYNGDSIGGHLLAGYSHQFGRFVVGAEADVELKSAFSRDSSFPDSAFGGAAGPECLNPPIGVPSIPPGHFGCVGLRQNFGEVKTYGHVRAKLGVEVTPALMTFVTGGLAVGRAPDYYSATASGIIVNNPNAPLVGQATVTRTGVEKTILGYSIGGGVEVKVSQNLRLRTEYMYDDYGTVEQKPVGGAGFGGTIGDLTTNSFVGIGSGGVTQTHISSQAVRVTAIFQF